MGLGVRAYSYLLIGVEGGCLLLFRWVMQVDFVSHKIRFY